MLKRPLCLAAVLILVIQVILIGGFRIAKDLKPSVIEKTVKEGASAELLGRVSRREEKAESQAIYLTDVTICHNNQIIKESKILVYIEQNNSEQQFNNGDYLIGNKIWVKGVVNFFEPAVNEGNFDQKFYYQKQGVHAFMWAEEVALADSDYSIIKEKLAVFRKQWKILLTTQMGENYGNSMSAILLGDKEDLDSEVKELYQKSGIGHILSISGLHMSFLGIGFYHILRKAGASFLLAGIIGVLFLSLYTIMIGAGVSSLRAMIMFLVRIGADMTGRVYDLPTGLSLAAIVLILCQPLYLIDAGFLLSFGAILGIFTLEPILRYFCIFPKFLCGGMAIHIMTFPIILYFYFEIPLYSQLLNLLVIPLMSFLLGGGIFGSILCALRVPVGNLVLKFCSMILWLYEKFCGLSIELPFSRIVTGQPPIWMMVIYYVILLCITYKLWKIKDKTEKKEESY